MKLMLIVQIFAILFVILAFSLAGYLFCLIVKALKKYIGSGEQRKEQKIIRQSLGEVLKSHRLRCGMTQELVAERLGVSRQAVSKWESGASEPSTSNLLALARLFEISPEELLREVAYEEA